MQLATELGDYDTEMDEANAWVLQMNLQLVKEAKKAEWKRLLDFKTFEVVPREEARTEENPVIDKTRWVLVNTGTTEAPMPKARLVAKEFQERAGAEGIFSGTPDLSGIKAVLADLATDNAGRKLMIVDIKRGLSVWKGHPSGLY